MTVDPGDGNVETYAGIARFIVVQGTLGWVLTEWRDLDMNGSFPTSGLLPSRRASRFITRRGYSIHT